MLRKICAVTGGRADWGLLSRPLAAIRDDKTFELQLIATGQHLDGRGTASLDAIHEDGFTITAKVDMLLSADHPAAITKSMGMALIGFADVLRDLKPDLLLVLGDRYEIMAAVQSAMVARVPVAHLCGGDTTEGAIDEAIRHSITKMAHLHFVTNADAEKRIQQLGEDPKAIFNVGSSGLDNIRLTPPLSAQDLCASVGLPHYDRNIMVTFHPVTLEMDSEKQCAELLQALDALGNNIGILITGTNADTDNKGVDSQIQKFVAAHDNVISVDSLGAKRYYSALAYVDCVVGNSSSGLYEAPSFGIPTVNIGNRQRGRLQASSIMNCPPERNAILETIQAAFEMDCTDTVNPYGDGHASEKILAALQTISNPKHLLLKKFYNTQASIL